MTDLDRSHRFRPRNVRLVLFREVFSIEKPKVVFRTYLVPIKLLLYYRVVLL